IAREEAEALCKPGLLDQTLGGPQRLRQVKDGRRQSRIGLAERHRVRPGAAPQIQKGLRAAEVDLLGQRRCMLQGHVLEHHQHVLRQPRVRLEHMALHRGAPGANDRLKPAPVVPLGLLQQEQMAGILWTALYEVLLGLRRVQKLLAALPERADRNERVQEDFCGLAIGLYAAGYLRGRASPSSESAKDVELDRRQQNLAFPVVAKLEDVGK